jgi:hypothetical protein
MRHEGGCHCGAVRLVYESAVPPEQAPVRACRCGFCRRHGSRAISDPEGKVVIDILDGGAIRRYRFGTRTADYLLCGRCGVYVAAVTEGEGGARAVVIVNALDEADRFTQPPDAVDFSGEDAIARRERRLRSWTPASFGS